ncbi:MAG: ECF transporter S component [Pyrodictiaceae archaeon]
MAMEEKAAIGAGYTVVGLVVRIAVYTAITFIATVLLVVETPATGGYFNLGEASIYAIAAIAPPLATAIAAGLGPALADLVLGYWYFAPATFAIKFTEGFVVSYLMRRLPGRISLRLRALTAGLGLALALVVSVNGLGGAGGGFGAELAMVNASLAGLGLVIPSLVISAPAALWLVISLLIAILSLSLAVISARRPYMLAMAVGGLIMVTGYFLYEYFFSNPIILHRDPAGAFFEIPVNIGQFVAGILLSYPVVHFVARAGAAVSERP